MTSKARGFTLIEILVVIGIIAVLAAIVIVAINPARQFAQARDTQRVSDVSAISNAIGQYMADHRGDLPGSLGDTATEISTSGEDICGDLVPKYMAALPVDPNTGDGVAVTDCDSSYSTGYEVKQDATTKRVTVSAPEKEIDDAADIAVTR